MKKVSLSKTLLLAGSILTLAFSCTCQKKEEMKGPQQDPMQNCECTDCECEEGASSTAVTTPEEPMAAVEEVAAPEKIEQPISVTPVVIEAVKIEMGAPEAVAVVKEEAPVPEKVESVVTETVSAQKLEVTETVENQN